VTHDRCTQRQRHRHRQRDSGTLVVDRDLFADMLACKLARAAQDRDTDALL
jgi:hypothetical protein